MDKQKLLDKIRKCFALSKSNNPNEAAAAMRQAQALMRKGGITEAEILGIGFAFERIEIPVQKNKTIPNYLIFFTNMIKKAFGVRPILSWDTRVSDRSYNVRYFGPEDRILMAAYAHTVCWRAMQSSWATYLKENPHMRGARGARMGFFIGWIEQVYTKVEEIGFTTQEETATEMLIVANTTALKSTTNLRNEKVYTSTRLAGEDSAKDFSIHRPMRATRLGIMKQS